MKQPLEKPHEKARPETSRAGFFMSITFSTGDGGSGLDVSGLAAQVLQLRP
ncbi:hypothetical protein QQF40_10065 [Cobetia sp. LC6]|uniref:hypothetical protein n=1 Tax=Cobetia sp. LC6 TaxID=3050947 RepID=UPI002552E632|nr:hypothetical protein [Cobetia sp. LC6]MDL2191738.1 hypothetical protein [Cobetia sp. LC6]